VTLAPRESRSRDCRRLDGLWRFRFDPGGNHKGVFTHDRQPKAVAWLLRDLWRQR